MDTGGHQQLAMNRGVWLNAKTVAIAVIDRKPWKVVHGLAVVKSTDKARQVQCVFFTQLQRSVVKNAKIDRQSGQRIIRVRVVFLDFQSVKGIVDTLKLQVNGTFSGLGQGLVRVGRHFRDW